MRTFRGFIIHSKDYTNREDVPTNEVPENIEGAVLLRYDLIAENKEEYINGTTSRKYSFVIECDFKDTIEPEDVIYIRGDWYEVAKVDISLPKDKEGIVKAWPNQYERYALKRVYCE